MKMKKQKDLEKLIDWDLRKQLTWAAILLSSILGLVSLLVSNKLNQWINLSQLPQIDVDFNKIPLLIIFAVLLIFGVDLSFYRLSTSLIIIRNWQEMLSSSLLHEELIDRAILQKLYKLFAKRTDENHFCIRSWFVGLLIIIGDSLLIWTLWSIN